jgi:hypothetical protein
MREAFAGWSAAKPENWLMRPHKQLKTLGYTVN